MKHSSFDVPISALDAETSALNAETSALDAETSVLDAEISALDTETSALDAEMLALGAAIVRSYRRVVFGDIGDCGVGVTPQMCNRVTNHGDMGTFSRPGLRQIGAYSKAIAKMHTMPLASAMLNR